MRFKQFLEAKINPLFYDLETPEGKAEYERDQAEVDEIRVNLKARGKVSQRQSGRKPVILTCWKGTTDEELERMSAEQGQGYRILDPNKSRSGAIWFTHEFQNGGREYAEGHGTKLITYSLKCTGYFDKVQYQDGTSEIQPNKEMAEKVWPFAESPYAILGDSVVQTPSGWQFSEHGENHAICEVPLKITDDMISRL